MVQFRYNMASYRVYMYLSVLWSSWCWVHGENCHVNPECACYRYNGTSVSCKPKCGPNIPKFSVSSVQFAQVTITGRRDIIHIQDNSFQGLVTNKLTIENTGIAEVPCNAWKNLEDTLTELELKNNYLTSVPTCSLQPLSKLKHLSLVSNNIAVIPGDAFQGLTSLQDLYVQRNKITEIGINTFKDLKDLKILYLAKNQITQIDGSSFRGLSALSNLDLSDNNISVLHPKSFSDLKQLNVLSLVSNNITSVDSTLFQGLTNLRSLYLGSNKICRLPDLLFLDNRELYLLHLYGNCLTSLQGNIFPADSELRELNLDNNHLTSFSTEAFRNLPKLNTIYLRGNKLTEIGEGVYGVLPNIESVFFTRNNIRTLHADAFRNLANLRNLDISENKLKRIGPTIFDNSTRLSFLDFSHNQITFMDQSSLNGLTYLYNLQLDNNNISSSSFDLMLKTVRNIRHLDLSNNPLHTLPSQVFNSLSSGDVTLNLRHCDLFSVPQRLDSVSLYSLDLSSNNLGSFGTKDVPQYVAFDYTHPIFSPGLNISENKLKSFNIILTSRVTYGFRIYLSHNLLQMPTIITTTKRYLSIGLLDLSYNHIENMTQFPISFFRPGDTQPQNLCNGSSSFSVNTLNLSRNAISFISSEACLGLVYKLDLSYNQLSVLDRLMPSKNSSKFRLRYLYLYGNNIHKVTPDAVISFENLHTFDLRFNKILSLGIFEGMLKGSKLNHVFLSGNSINCDCSLSWLQNGSISGKLDLVRCQSPLSARAFLVFCYPLTDCPIQRSIDITDNTTKICNKDSALELSNLTVTSSVNIAEVFWTKTGPGKISSYKLELREIKRNGAMKTLLIHPNVSSTAVINLMFQQTYNFCLSALLHDRRVSNELCAHVMISGEETCAGVDVVIGLSVPLALCLIIIIGLVICTFCRKKDSYHTDSSAESARGEVKQTETWTNPNDQYQHRMKPTVNDDDGEKLYDDLDHGQYENSALENQTDM